MILGSIRWRLQFWHGLILTAVVAGFGLTAYQLESAHRLRSVDDELSKRNGLLTSIVPPGGNRPPPRRDDGRMPPPPDDGPRVRGGPGGQRFNRNVADLFEAQGPGDFYYVVWSAGGRVQASSSNAPPDIPPPDETLSREWQQGRTRGHYREFLRYTPADRTILTGRSLAPEIAELARLRWWLTFAGAGVLVAGLAGGWWLASRAIRPIADISDAANRIATGDLSQRIGIADTDNELGQLAAVLNSTFARLEASFAQQARFTADAAHELRTPVSVILTHMHNGLDESCNCPEHREAMDATSRAAQRMRRLIESLLDLARLDAEHAGAGKCACDAQAIVEECVELVRPLAAQARVALHLESRPATCSGDAVRIAQVVTNLLSNAIHYNRPDGDVRVTVCARGPEVIIVVADTGKGIDPQDLPHIFERFFRADRSRSRPEGRTGLGLAICKAIVDAHGGRIDVESQPGRGSTFTLVLPSHSDTAPALSA